MNFCTKRILSMVAILVACAGFLNCGSGAISTSTSPTTSASESSAEDMAQSMVGSTAAITTTASTLATSLALKKLDTAGTIGPTACATSGTQTYTYDFSTAVSMTWTYDLCDFGYGFVFDGSMSVTGESDGTTVEGAIGFDNYSYDDGTTSFSVDGSIDFSWDNSTELVTATYDLTSTEGANDLTLTGSITLDTDHVANGTVTVTYNSLSFTCTVTDLDLDTTEESDFANACS